MPELRLTVWSLPELLGAMFAASVVLTSYLQPLSERRERAASMAFRWIMLAVALLMFSLFWQHSGLVDTDNAMWWTYLVATTLTPLGIRLARASGRRNMTALEVIYIVLSLALGVALLIRPQWFVLGIWANPLGYIQARVTVLALFLVILQVLAVIFSARRLYSLRRFGPMEGARILTFAWSIFGLTALIDQMTMSFQWPLPPVFWMGAMLLTAVFTRVIGVHHQRIAHTLQRASRERSHILERIAQDEPLPSLLSSIEQLPLLGHEENQRLAQTAQEHHRLLRDLEFRAAHDPLTGLANRIHLAQRLQEHLAQSQQLALMVIDLNGFKRINDTLGHAAGDALLIEVARRLSWAIPTESTLARFGGDEFVVLLPRGSIISAMELAKHMTQRMKEPFELLGLQMFVSASIGISFADRQTPDLVLLHGQADMAMYYAKERGEPWMIYRNHMGKDFQDRLTLENALREAVVDAKQFNLVYQPIVSLSTGEVVAVEALLRWNSPDLGPIAPLKFIPVAEESGLIVPLGKWILHQACGQAAQWQNLSSNPVGLCVNVSAQQFEHPEFVETVKAALKDSGLPSQRLTLEVVESVMMHRFEEVAERFRQLQALGVKIALDDFGTGFSSLNYIHQLSFDVLKIDRSFVQPLTYSSKAHALVDSIVHLAHSLGKKVVVEGIETPDQQALVQDLRSEYAQGFLFAKPLPVGELQTFIEQNEFRLPRLELTQLLKKPLEN